MKILFRISQGGNNKHKLPFVYDKKIMFIHFVQSFKNHDIYVFADNVNDDLFQFMATHFDSNKIYRTSLGNAKSFIHITDFAIQNFTEEDKIYFAEDDYIYKTNADIIIEEGLNISDYSCGYDHPDKYVNSSDGGNPYIVGGGEETKVLLTSNTHWKYTNSFCMTFATRVKTIKEDYDILTNNCNGKDPHDFQFFCEAREKKNRKLVSCIPAVCTHGELMWLSPFVNWEPGIS